VTENDGPTCAAHFHRHGRGNFVSCRESMHRVEYPSVMTLSLAAYPPPHPPSRDPTDRTCNPRAKLGRIKISI